jgi:hypothetical protein
MAKNMEYTSVAIMIIAQDRFFMTVLLIGRKRCRVGNVRYVPFATRTNKERHPVNTKLLARGKE